MSHRLRCRNENIPSSSGSTALGAAIYGNRLAPRLAPELPVEPGPPILGFSSNVELRCRRPWIFGLGWFPAVGTGNCQKMSNHVVYSFYRPPNWSVTIWRPTPNTLYKASRALPTCHELESLTLCQTLYINSLDQLCDIFWMFSLSLDHLLSLSLFSVSKNELCLCAVTCPLSCLGFQKKHLHRQLVRGRALCSDRIDHSTHSNRM